MAAPVTARFEPEPSTATVLDLLGGGQESPVDRSLRRLTAQVRQVVPALTALSLTLDEEDVTLVVGTPAVVGSVPVEHPAEQPLGRPAVGCTLSVPVRISGRVVGRLDLYGSAPDTFHGRVLAVARLVHASSGEVAVDADLGFECRRRSAESLVRVRG